VTIKSLLFILFLSVCLIWVGAAYLHPGPELQRYGLLWTALLLMVALAAIAGARVFGWWRLWRAKAATRPKPSAKPSPSVHEDDAALSALLAEANQALVKAPGYRGQRGKSPLSELPLYLLIGPQGVGKTSTFLNAGLEPQLLAGEAGGNSPASTRVCNLWLAKNAVFAEISGRMFSGEVGRWSELLGVLRGKASAPFWRRLWGGTDTRLTLRGVVAFGDVKELTSAAGDPQRLERSAREWQERLRAISGVFGTEFPVYQVFTKCDKIPFFTDFFGRVPESETNQVLGCTLPIRKPDPSKPGEPFAEAEARRLTGAFRPLYHSLAERRITHLTHEPNPARKPGIYEFPRELKRLRGHLLQFLTDVFRPAPLRPVPFLRGFYLTAVQEVELAAAMPVASRADWTSPNLGLEATRLLRGDATQIFNPDEGNKAFNGGGRKGIRWIFAADLFHQVVLADRPLQTAVPTDVRFEWFRNGAAASVVGLCILLCFAFVGSWAQNRQLLRDVADAGSNGATKRSSLATLADLRSLDRLRSQVESLQNGKSLSYHWGLYSGNAILADAQNVYFKRFQQLLLNDLNGSILGQLGKLPSAPGPADPDEPAFSLLKTHLTISSGSCKAEPAQVLRVLKQARGQLGEADAEWQSLADRQIAFYVGALVSGNPCRLAEDSAVRDYARQYLQNIKGIDRIYQRILENAAKASNKAQRLDDVASNYKQVLSGQSEVSAAFTHEGWQFVQNASKDVNAGGLGDPCVFGNTSGVLAGVRQDAALEKAIQQRYLRDYIDAWQKFVAGFSVVPYKTPADAMSKLDSLAGSRSPLLALLAMTSNQTDFTVNTTQSSVVTKAGKAIGDLIKTGEQTATRVADLGKDKHEEVTPADITRYFQPVHLVVPAFSERWVNEKNTAYTDALAGLRSTVQAMSRSTADAPDPQIAQLATQSVDKAEDSVRQLAKGFNPDGVGNLDREVTRLLNEPIKNSRPFITPPKAPPPGAGTEAELRKFCTSFQPLLRKYPFNPAATEASGTELTLEDLASYFAPQKGTVWKLQASALAEFTAPEGGVWKQNPAAQKLKASQELLDFLNRAQDITRAFFADGLPNVHLSFALRPLLEENSGQLIEFTFDGRRQEFSRNLMRQQQFTWPAPVGAPPEALGRSGISGFRTAFSSHGGLWATFRMFGDAEPRDLGQKRINWVRTRGPSGRSEAMETPVRVEFVVLPGGVDVFNPKFFEGFHCPAKALQ
jgi:type VI secretion system protein ImpL